MKCPKCKGLDVYVLDSRHKEDVVKRRRECSDCGARFSTVEIPTEEYAHLVETKSRVDGLPGQVEGSKDNGTH